MIFSHWFYILLLFTSVIFFFVVPKRWRKVVLFISGIIFYSYFAGTFAILILLETILAAFLLHHGLRRIGLALAVTLSILTYFKYRMFITESFNDISTLVNAGLHLPVGSLAVPLAISFFTFEFIHVIADVNRRKIANLSFIDLGSFIFFFPTLVAGPIKRFNEFHPQIEKARLVPENVFYGIYRILTGLFKKMVLADTFAVMTGSTFSSLLTIQQSTAGVLWIALISFSFRIYFDFSGYSDIAIGSARLFGIIVPENFIRPYVRSNIAEFWKNWHRSLYRWIVDYIYIPLGGSRRGFVIACRNTLFAMTISGIWHGAAWHFLIWGIYHGLLLCLYRLWRTRTDIKIPLPVFVVRFFSILITFTAVSLGWLFFIAPVHIALFALVKMTGLSP